MRFADIITGTEWTTDCESRNGHTVKYFIVHHAYALRVRTILDLFAPGGRLVSANFALGEGQLIQTVPRNQRAYTSGTALDAEAITVEVANASLEAPYPVRDTDFHLLAKLIAAWATEYGRPINGDTVLMHFELYERFNVSYPTACAGDLNRRKTELLTLARTYYAGGSPAGGSEPVAPELEDEEEMSQNIMYETSDTAYKYRAAIGNDTSGLWVEWVTSSPAFLNMMAAKYKTGDSLKVSPSMFYAAKSAHAATRPQSNITVTVGEEEIG